jgi:hypothetical protein
MPNTEAKIDDLLGSLGDINKLAEKDNAQLCAVDSKNVPIHRVVDNHILGLLTQKTLSSVQVNLLGHLVNYSVNRK